jgi:hypothetical protein
MNTKTCPNTGRPLPDSLAGFQLVCSSEQRTEKVQKDDLLVFCSGEWAWASGLISCEVSGEGTVDHNIRVYRKLAVPKPGDLDTCPSGGLRLLKTDIPAAAHYSDPAPRPSELPAARTQLPATAADRKAIPIATGFVDYFPDAMAEVARLSKAGNDQHHPGEPLHWDKSKSTDEADALMRHFLDRGTRDTDGQRHSAKVAWRAMALLQREIDAERARA